MRFAYIDSNGNEVPIPSVDALALRIELGAINDKTELYDAQADQWGPAHTHEIFHTLSRAAEEGDGGFVAPLPPMSQPVAAPEPVEEEEAPEPEPVPEPAAVVEEPEPEPEPVEAEPEPEPEVEADFGLDLAPSMADTPLLEEEEGSGGEAEAAPEEAAAAPSFDFGDLDGGLEMAGGFEEPADAEPVVDFGASSEDFGAGLEQPMEFSSAGADSGPGSLDLETPMSEFSSDDPPGWMEPEDIAGDAGEVMDFSSISSDSVATEEPAAVDRSKRSTRDKPSPPRFKKRRSVVGPIVTVVVLSALGIGGFVLWPIVEAQLAGGDDPVPVQVPLPPLAPELMPQLNAASEAALSAWFTKARAEVGAGAPRPPEEWLAGVYFANASSFEGVATFWTHIQDQLAAVRALDADAFLEELDIVMARAGVAEADRGPIRTRAEAEFDAAEAQRIAAFRSVDEVVDAAIGLHDFLVANEANIEYTPAASVTSDPVLEAKPSIPEIGDAMEDRIDRVTGALDRLDYLDQVTAEGFWQAVLTRVQAQGIR